jgi:hypothetical protein
MGGVFGSIPSSSRYSPSVIFGIGWASVLFFGFGSVVFARMLFDTKPQLQIGLRGIRWVRWSDDTIPWSEIADVTSWSYRRQKAIILHLRHPDRYPGRGYLAMLARVNRRLTGGDIAITLAGTDRSFADAMSAIEQFRPRQSH